MSARRILAILTVPVALVLCLGVRNARSGPATPAAATTPFVFWPGGIADPATSVYTDWTSLYVAASAVTNPTVIVDDSAGAAEVPSGTWTVDGWTLESGSNDWATLYFADGALMVLHDNLIVDQGLTLETEATSAPTFTALPGYYPATVSSYQRPHKPHRHRQSPRNPPPPQPPSPPTLLSPTSHLEQRHPASRPRRRCL